MGNNINSVFSVHRPAETQAYRQHLLSLWAQWRPDLVPRSLAYTAADLLLPPASGRRALSFGPAPVDVICVGLISHRGTSLALLLPPGWGKTSLALELCGLGSAGSSHKLRPPGGRDFRLLCSDVAWISTLGGRLCFHRPVAELLLFAWDMSRQHARRLIGISQFEAERCLPMERRTQTMIFRQLVMPEPLPIIGSDYYCFPDIVIIPSQGFASHDCHLDDWSAREIHNVLHDALYGQAIYESHFWKATSLIKHRISDILRAVRVWPEVWVMERPRASSTAYASQWVRTRMQRRNYSTSDAVLV